MDLELTEEQAHLQAEAIKFAEQHLAADLIDRDRDQLFDRTLWQRCADWGLLGLPIPKAYGGVGLNLSNVIAVMEGLGYAAKDQGLLFSVNAHLWTNSIPILLYGTEEQKQKYLPGLSNGRLIGANGASEPDAGSDIFSMRTRAIKQGDHYVLNGTKTFVSNAPVADVFVCYATIDPTLGPMGVTGFIIERDRPGLSVSRKLEKMGLRTSPMGEVIFEDCKVPVDQRLGREGRGAAVFQSSMEWERGCILASCLGVMRSLLERCLAHARTRTQFGKPIGKYQSLQNLIVDMKVRLDTSRPLVYRIGALKDAGKSALMEAAIAKLHVSESYVQSCLDAVQVFGGYGYMTEQEIERELRNAIASKLYSGTSEIQRGMIAKHLGL